MIQFVFWLLVRALITLKPDGASRDTNEYCSPLQICLLKSTCVRPSGYNWIFKWNY